MSEEIKKLKLFYKNKGSVGGSYPYPLVPVNYGDKDEAQLELPIKTTEGEKNGK